MTRICHADGVFILPQMAQIFTDFLLLGQQLLADEWMCSPHGNNLCGVSYRPPLLPLKWGGQVCLPLERAMIWRTGLSASWKGYGPHGK